MKVCEYENIRCPYCGSIDKPLTIDNADVIVIHPLQRKIFLAHVVTCSKCSGVFCLPCEC